LNEYDTLGRIIRKTDAVGLVSTYAYDADDNLLAMQGSDCDCATSFTYDASGNLLTETDEAGHTRRYTYNSMNKVLTFTDEGGFLTTNSYDSLGNLLSTRDPVGSLTRFTYTSQGQVSSMIDARGGGTRFEYDARGRLVREISALTNTTTYTSDANGQLTSITRQRTLNLPEQAAVYGLDASATLCDAFTPRFTNVVFSFTYDSGGHLIGATLADLTRITNGFNEVGMQTSSTDQLGQTTIFDLNYAGKPLRIAYPDETTELFGYNAEGLLETSADRAGRTTSFTYDGVGRMKQITFPDGRTVNATRDLRGRLLTESDSCHGTTTYTYDSVGNRISSSHPDSGSATYHYNAKRACTNFTDALGHTTLMEFDALNRNTRILYPNGESKTSTYEGRMLTSITDEAGHTTRFGFDLLGRMNQQVNPLGKTRTLEHDELGNLRRVTDENGESTVHDYDDMGRRKATSYPDGKSRAFGYDSLGRMNSATDTAGGTMTFDHNTRNQLTRVTDPLGNETTFTYEATGQRHSMRDAKGQTTVWNHDALGRPTTTEYPDGTSEVVDYDACNRIRSATDRGRGVTSFTYDSLDQVRTVTAPDGLVTTFGYDPVGNMTSQSLAGKTTVFGYDSRNRLTTITRPDGTTEGRTYDPRGLLATRRDALGNTTTYGYDSVRRMASVTDPLGHATSYTYDDRGSVSSLTDPLGHTTGFVYDPNGRLKQRLHPDGGNEIYTYNDLGLLETHTDPLGHITRYGYDANGQLKSRTDAMNHVWTYDYDELGRVKKNTDPNERATSFTYDAMGRTKTITYADGAVESFTYDDMGRRLTETDGRGNTTTYTYDVVGRLSTVKNAENETISYFYDGLGNLDRMEDPDGRSTTYVRDAMGRIKTITHPGGTTSSFTYDLAGQRTKVVDEGGAETGFAYDAAGRMTTVTDPLGHVTVYGYDAADRLISQTDALSRTSTYDYDEMDRRTARSLPGGGNEHLTYDLAGNPSEHTDFNGTTCTYGYNAVDQLISQSQPLVTWSYDPAGPRASMTDSAGTTTYGYNARYRFNSKTRTWNDSGTSVALTYGRDFAGNVTGVNSSAANGASFTYTYDAVNRLKSVHDPHNGDTLYSYDTAGRLANITRENGLQTTYGYSARDLVSTATTTGGTPPVFSQYAYTYGNGGNRLTAVETLSGNGLTNTLTRTYGYDPAYRLTSETITAGGQTSALGYTYDAVGNRLTRTSTLAGLPAQSFAYDDNDQLVSDGYDANGNTTNATVLDPFTALPAAAADSYDHADRLVQRVTTLNSQLATLQYQYDGDGNRVSKRLGNVTTHYVVDELNPTGWPQVLEEQTWQPGSVAFNSPATTRVLSYGHAPLAQQQLIGNSWSASHFGHDAHGSVRYLTDSVGQLTDTFDYDAFGNLISHAGTTPVTHLYASEEFDADLGLYQLRARYLNPGTGRFWTRDSFEGYLTDPASRHAYTYAQNDPANRVDPGGHYVLNEALAVSAIGLDVQRVVSSLWAGINQYGHGLGGGESLKAANYSEGLFIASLSEHAGWKLGRQNFFTTLQGAPFLLANNPMVFVCPRCYRYDILGFDTEAPIYGCANKHPAFTFDFSNDPNFKLAENLAYASQSFAVSAALAPAFVAAPVLFGGAGSAVALSLGASAESAGVFGVSIGIGMDLGFVGAGGFAAGIFVYEQSTHAEWFTGQLLSDDDLVRQRYQLGGTMAGGLAASPVAAASRSFATDLVADGLSAYARSLQAARTTQLGNFQLLLGNEGAAEAALAKVIGQPPPPAAPMALDTPTPCIGAAKEEGFGLATTANYRKTFLAAYPELEGKVVVHHGVEQQTLKLYPFEVSPQELHSLENLRGIPNEINSELHLSTIRGEWDEFYLENPFATQEQLLQQRAVIDAKYGHLFLPPVK